MLQSTLVGGDYKDYGQNVAVDNGGVITIAGITEGNFDITCGAWDTTHNSGTDIFIARLSPYLDYLIYSTYLGGSGKEEIWRGSLTLNAFQKATVAGWTLSPNMPMAGNPFQGVPQAAPNASDGFLAAPRLPAHWCGPLREVNAQLPWAIMINVTNKPYINQPGFKAISSGGPGQAYGIFMVGLGGLPTPMPLLGVDIYIDLTYFFLPVFLRSDPNGFNELPLPIPNNKTLIGASLYFQYIWLNTPGCGGANTYSSTDALKVVIQAGC